MSDELQEALDADGVLLSEELPEVESAREEAPAEDEGEKLSGYDKRISVLTARLREKEQKLAQYEAAQLTREEMEEPAPEIPDLPDDDLRIDDPTAYRQKIKERDQAILNRATYEAKQALKRESSAVTERKRATEQQAKNQEVIAKYIENGLHQGLSEDRMLANESILKSVNINKDLAHFLYADESGAKLVDYLARNPDQLQELAALPPTIAAVRIATDLKQKALATKPHVTKAPDPAVPTRGGGKPMPDDWSRFEVSGATFE